MTNSRAMAIPFNLARRAPCRSLALSGTMSLLERVSAMDREEMNEVDI